MRVQVEPQSTPPSPTFSRRLEWALLLGCGCGLLPVPYLSPYPPPASSSRTRLCLSAAIRESKGRAASRDGSRRLYAQAHSTDNTDMRTYYTEINDVHRSKKPLRARRTATRSPASPGARSSTSESTVLDIRHMEACAERMTGSTPSRHAPILYCAHPGLPPSTVPQAARTRGQPALPRVWASARGARASARGARAEAPAVSGSAGGALDERAGSSRTVHAEGRRRTRKLRRRQGRRRG